MTRYKRRTDGEGFTVPCGEVYRIACCDCGLVHDFVFVSEDGKPIGVAARRNARATGQKRLATKGTDDHSDELADLRRDAERYRSIRRPSGLDWPIAVFDIRHPMNKGKTLPHECVGDEFDLLVDAAMSAGPNGANDRT